MAAAAGAILALAACQGSAVPTPAAATATAEAAPPTPAAPTVTPARPLIVTEVISGTSLALEVTTSTSSSPDGQWTALTTLKIPAAGLSVWPDYHQQLRVFRADGRGPEWIAYDTWSPYGLGYTLPAPLRWSRSGGALYFTNVPMPDGCAQFVNGSDLWRLDLTSGEVAQLAPDLGLSLSLSPDEQTLAYRAYGDRELVLRDLLTGQARAVPVAGGQPAGGFGRLTWSPDGKQLLFMAAAEPCGPGPQTLVHVDAATLAQRVVLHDDDGRFTLLEWPEAGRALLAAAEGPVWLDPITGALTPGATPTPGPAP